MTTNNICDCGHAKGEHFNTEGACDKCGCTWYHKRITSGQFFRCDCGSEAIHIERDLELLDDGNRYACFLNFSIYHFGTENHRPTWHERLRHCWYILKTGKNYADQIILNEDTAKKLGEAILSMMSQDAIGKEINDE